MKNLRKILLLILSLTLMFGLFACGTEPCTEHTDENGDGKCDVCGEKVDTPPCETCVDSDGDGKCDECGGEVSAIAVDIPLITDGKANFQIVIGKNIDADVRKAVIKDIQTVLRNKYGVEVKVVDEGSKDDAPQDVEILIGDITTRGDEYKFDRYSLGKDGYVIKMIGTKILIHGGSNESLADTVIRFSEDILAMGGKTLPDSTMTAEQEKYEKQDDYKITSVAVNGTSLDGYVIATDKDDMYHYRALRALQDGIYDKTGYFLPIVSLAEAGEKTVLIIEPEKKVYGEESFNVKAEGTKLIMRCSFDNMLESAISQFLTAKIATGSGDIDFKNTVYTQDISVVYYEDFGAKGDGVTNDFKALYDTHAFANECGQTVLANKTDKPYCVYYISDTLIGASTHTINIQTNTDWRGVEFIIDDTNIFGDDSSNIPSINSRMASASIFSIIPNDDHAAIKISGDDVTEYLLATGIDPSTKKIDINRFLPDWDGAVMIIPYNNTHKVYRRIGYDGGHLGSAQHEVIVLDKDGNVSPETPIMFEYTDITYIMVYKLDESSAITVKNATVTTKACALNMVYYNTVYHENRYRSNYIYRNLNVTRSYTTVENISHYVTGEIPLSEQAENGVIVSCGASYRGFYSASDANRVTFKDCIITGRRCYKRPEGGTQGTYDLSASNVNKIVFEDCTQHNFWVTVDPDTLEIRPATKDTPDAVTSMSQITVNGVTVQMHWGVGGTNFCKNMEYIDSTLSRYDAHQGLYNGKIINSTVNYLALTGSGEFIFEDSTWYQSSSSVAFMALRADYGYTWDGKITIKNSQAFVYDPSSTAPRILLHGYSNWYFGYTCAVPNLEIDGLMFYDISDVTGGKPAPPGTNINIMTSVSATSKFHLNDAGTAVRWTVVDDDGDGYIDEPLLDLDGDGFFDPKTDLDGDGKVGNTRFLYEDTVTSLGDGIVNGKHDSATTVNINRIKPPEYIKIINNDGGYVYNITDTSEQDISDGGYYTETDTMGGFFGGTKFIYGEGEDEYFLGSGHKKQTKTTTFKFN